MQDKYVDAISKATLEQAHQWKQADDKWLYCEKVLNCRLSNSRAVYALEDKFEALLKEID